MIHRRDQLYPAVRALAIGERVSVAPGSPGAVSMKDVYACLNNLRHTTPGVLSRALEDDGSITIARHPPGAEPEGMIRSYSNSRARKDPRPAQTRSSPAASSSAARAGRAAAINGEPISACPYRAERDLPLAADWRNAWTAEREAMRRKRDRADGVAADPESYERICRRSGKGRTAAYSIGGKG